MKSLRTLIVLLFLTAALVLGLSAANIGAADHLDSPQVMADGRLDINDVYAFQSPENPDNTVLVMTVNPLAGVVSPLTFSTSGRYYFNIDQNGDAKADLTYELLFRDRHDGSQKVTLVSKDANGARRLITGATNQVLEIPGGGKLTASLFDDPFFFDLTSFRNGLTFCDGDEFDFFAGFNTSAIVLEVPSEWLGPDNIGVWAHTKLGDLQFDRKGRPAVNTVFIPSDQKDAFNRNLPQYDQVNYRDEVVATIVALSGDPALAEALADVLLPDILTIDTSNPAGFLNGRALADDVIDAELNLITGGAVPSDCVDSNDKAFSPTFPYLAEPHMVLSSEQ
jgi:hypothetical protein